MFNYSMLKSLNTITRQFSSNMMRKDMNRLLFSLSSKKYQQVKDLHQTMYLAELEENQRKAKFLEYTTKIYKPSKTITFDRNGEALLFQVDNIKESQIYLKYPYVLFDAMIPLAFYIFFADPCIY